jgi:hypothetical protein
MPQASIDYFNHLVTAAAVGGIAAGATCLLQIMGNSYYMPLTQWSKGEYTGANQVSTCCGVLCRPLNSQCG